LTNPKKELREYLGKLINHFIFIKHIDDDLKLMLTWEKRPFGINVLVEGASFFNLVQRTFNQTFLIELCKFIDEDEQKSLRDFLNKSRENEKPLQATSIKIIADAFNHKVIPPDEYVSIVNNQIVKLESHKAVIDNLKARRNKVLAHTDAAFFNNPDKHYEKYPLMTEDIDKLLKTTEEILFEQGLYLLGSDSDFALYTTSGVDRVLEFMRAYYIIIQENSDNIKYRFDEYYQKKKQ